MGNNDVWFRSLVWMDYRLAVLFTVLIPISFTYLGICSKS